MNLKLSAAGLAIGFWMAACPSLPASEVESFQKKIDKAIDDGVAYLLGIQDRTGTWSWGGGTFAVHGDSDATTGSTALAGLTLLECGKTARDPAVKKAAAFVRQASVKLTYTYSLSLALMFLDRLGDPGD